MASYDAVLEGSISRQETVVFGTKLSSFQQSHRSDLIFFINSAGGLVCLSSVYLANLALLRCRQLHGAEHLNTKDSGPWTRIPEKSSTMISDWGGKANCSTYQKASLLCRSWQTHPCTGSVIKTSGCWTAFRNADFVEQAFYNYS